MHIKIKQHVNPLMNQDFCMKSSADFMQTCSMCVCRFYPNLQYVCMCRFYAELCM